MGNLSIKRSFKMLRSLTPFLFVTLSVIWAVDNDVCDKKICLQKCCDFNESRNQKGHCGESIFRHPFMNLANIHVVPKQRCREGEYAIYEPLDNIVYMENGSVSATDIDMIFHLDQYCFDNLDGIPGVFVCLSSDTVEAEKQHFIIYGNCNMYF
ncbi:hypothetical protein GWI33_018540 [Rhynchophorus ferrugineus]|uniref:Uncharacterized protein n=1 Tax=Rhynchophorus ferrugineus TaxID=354439 RepID=A0A834HXJ4_RHYFE|nr:hypothetical protein GWI33_018540 [Rhynchophorus ferrugineus]